MRPNMSSNVGDRVMVNGKMGTVSYTMDALALDGVYMTIDMDDCTTLKLFVTQH